MPPSHALSLMSAQTSMGPSSPVHSGSPALPWSLVAVVLVLGGAIALAGRAFRRRGSPPVPRRRARGAPPTGGDA